MDFVSNDSTTSPPNCTDNCTSDPNLPTWTYFPVITICTGTLTVILNSLVLIILFRKENIALPFTFYLINLLVANIMFVMLGNPLDVVNGLYKIWPLGWTVCTIYLYAYYVVACAVVSAQALITFNRLWAMTFPVHYRTHHTRPVAFALCCIMWIYVHICLGSGVFADALYYRLPLDPNGCAINIAYLPLRYWGLITQWLNFNIPIVLGAVSYCFIVRKIRKRLRRQMRIAAQEKNAPVRTKTFPLCGSVPFRQPEKSLPVITALSVDNPKKSQARSQSFLVLTLVTWTNFINLVPSQVYFTTVYYVDPSKLDMLLRVSSIMLSLQAALNPILYAVSMANVKSTLKAGFAVVVWRFCNKYTTRSPVHSNESLSRRAKKTQYSSKVQIIDSPIQ